MMMMIITCNYNYGADVKTNAAVRSKSHKLSWIGA